MRRQGRSAFRVDAVGGRRLRQLPPALKALLAQLCGWALAILLLSLELLPSGGAAGALSLVLAQAVLAALAAASLRSARWWLAIHLGFSPLVWLAQGLRLAPGWYLAGFLTLAAVYWSSFRTQVPLYLSNRRCVAALAALLPQDRPVRFVDLGCGVGSVLAPLARLRPDCRFEGIESAPLPWLLCGLRCRKLPNVRVLRGDFFAADWSGYDVVYAFLSPVPMAAVGAKCAAQLAPGAVLVSNSFALPSPAADEVLELQDRRRTRLYVYRSQAAGTQAPAPDPGRPRGLEADE